MIFLLTIIGILILAVPIALGLLTLLGQALPHILGVLYRPLYRQPKSKS